jgi:hypothetical protein
MAVVIALILVWVSYLVGLAFYRLQLHPLSKFPGPKLAALTRDSILYRGGGYNKELRDL